MIAMRADRGEAQPCRFKVGRDSMADTSASSPSLKSSMNVRAPAMVFGSPGLSKLGGGGGGAFLPLCLQ